MGDSQGCNFLLLIYAVAYFSSFLGDVFDGIPMRICALEIITVLKKKFMKCIINIGCCCC